MTSGRNCICLKTMRPIQHTVYVELYWLNAKSTILIHYFVVPHLQVQSFFFLSKLSEPRVLVVVASLSRQFPGAVFTLMHFSGAFALKGFGAKASTEVREQWTWPSFCGRCCTSDTEVREVAANYCMITGKHQNSHFRQREQYRWLLWQVVCGSRRSRAILRQGLSHTAKFIHCLHLWVFQIYLIFIWRAHATSFI